MKENTLISVIIPCYNVELYISRCLQSVFDQTYRNIEIIAVDNVSKDNTLIELKRLSALSPFPFLILQEEKKGACAARNTGLKAAKGEWIQFLDADDALDARKIEVQTDVVKNGLQKSMAMIVAPCFVHENELVSVRYAGDNSWFALINGDLGNTCANLFSKPWVENVGFWNEQLKSSQDYDLMFWILKAGGDVFLSNEPLTHVYKRPDQSSISQQDVIGNIERRIALRASIINEVPNFLDEARVVELINHARQQIFNDIRRVASFSLPHAEELHKKYVKGQYRPKIDASNSAFYIRVYRLLGFKWAEIIKKLLKRK